VKLQIWADINPETVELDPTNPIQLKGQPVFDFAALPTDVTPTALSLAQFKHRCNKDAWELKQRGY